jgi:hypothetical protein
MNEPKVKRGTTAPIRRAVKEAGRRAERGRAAEVAIGLEPLADGEGNRGRGGGDRNSTQDGVPGSGRASYPPWHRTCVNGTRAPLILSLLLLLTLLMQVLLVAYHEHLVFNLSNKVEDGAIGGDGDDDGGGNTDDTTEDLDVGLNEDRGQRPRQEEGAPKNYSNYSMDPIDILQRADIDHSAGFIPSITGREARMAKQQNNMDSLVQKAKLPPVEEIQSMYGTKSYIVGLERCEDYREAVEPEHRLMGPAGLFNSATNLLYKLLTLNCENTERKRAASKRGYRMGKSGMMFTSPWGKHNPVSWRLHHEAKLMHGIEQTDFLPIVMIKDPITWMSSMCRHQYESRWIHPPKHCPNLVPNRYDRRRKPGVGTITLRVKFATKHIGNEPIPDNKNRTFVNYTSLVDMWNVWYKDWYDVSFPRLMVRFEDLLFHAEDVVSQVCACGGGEDRSLFVYVSCLFVPFFSSFRPIIVHLEYQGRWRSPFDTSRKARKVNAARMLDLPGS